MYCNTLSYKYSVCVCIGSYVYVAHKSKNNFRNEFFERVLMIQCTRNRRAVFQVYCNFWLLHRKGLRSLSVLLNGVYTNFSYDFKAPKMKNGNNDE